MTGTVEKRSHRSVTSGEGRAPVLEVRDFQLVFDTYRGTVNALEGVDLCVDRGESLGIVGETGCGKSATARAIMGFVDPAGRVVGGQILVEGQDVLSLSPRRLRAVRGAVAGFVFQEAKKALNPTATVGSQLVEAAQAILGLSGHQAKGAAREALAQVGLPDPERIMRSYSFELSGGMAQRVMIAIGTIGKPRLLIADEPTSALDVSIQAQILKLLREQREKLGSALVLITHDLGVAAENCDRIAVMYAGRVVETGPVDGVFGSPLHPYTAGLLAALPSPDVEMLASVPGSVPDLVDPPAGCRFSNRCSRASEVCRRVRPPVEELRPGHWVACYHPLDEPANH